MHGLDEMKARARTGAYHVHGDIADADCIVGFSFGFQLIDSVIMPGVSNTDIAAYILDQSRQLPLILQFEIAAAIPTYDGVLYQISTHRTPGQYLNTHEVASQAKEIMVTAGYEHAMLVAHAHHMPRADGLCTHLGMRTIAPAGLGTIQFDPLSAHPQTRDENHWITHEMAAIDSDSARGWL